MAIDNILGFICCSKILYAYKKIIQPYIETKPKNEDDFSDQKLRMQNSSIVRHLILRVLRKICLY